jgi:hypothetical protein
MILQKFRIRRQKGVRLREREREGEREEREIWWFISRRVFETG